MKGKILLCSNLRLSAEQYQDRQATLIGFSGEDSFCFPQAEEQSNPLEGYNVYTKSSLKYNFGRSSLTFRSINIKPMFSDNVQSLIKRD